MPNDAKLGMVLGVGLVLLIAAVFFRKEGVEAGEEPLKASTPIRSTAPARPTPKTPAPPPPPTTAPDPESILEPPALPPPSED